MSKHTVVEWAVNFGPVSTSKGMVAFTVAWFERQAYGLPFFAS